MVGITGYVTFAKIFQHFSQLPSVICSHNRNFIFKGLRAARSYPPMDCYKVGERVIVAGKKSGTLRFSGTTEFASGWWYGIELDHPLGRNDGSVNGKAYFVCKPNFGVFAPPSKVKR